jgi:hypothetical protein
MTMTVLLAFTTARRPGRAGLDLLDVWRWISLRLLVKARLDR